MGEVKVRWSEIAGWSGREVTPSVSFEELVKPSHDDGSSFPWEGAGPSEGTLTRDETKALVSVLAPHTKPTDKCWFCIWDGYGWDRRRLLSRPGTGASTYLPDPIPHEVRTGSRVRLPNREYFLYSGSLDGALALFDGQDQSPNLWWPEDRSWCVATEIDLCWTYVGGTKTVIEAILGKRALESIEVRISDPVIG